MSNKREQRLRRKARAQVRIAERQVAELAKLKPIALAAIRYIAEIDARNPHEPWSIANRRDELRDLVHARNGRPQRGERREPQAVRPVVPAVIAPVVPLRPVPPPPKKEAHVSNDRNREQLARDVEIKRIDLRNAAKKYGAEANKRNRNSARVAELGEALEAAARAFAVADSLWLRSLVAGREAAGAAS